MPSVAAAAPEAAAWLQSACDAAHRDIASPLLDVIRQRVAAGLGLGPEVYDGLLTPAVAALAVLTDQFVYRVADRRPDLVLALQERVGRAGTRELLEGMYALDQAARLSITHQRLFGPAGSRVPLAAPVLAAEAATGAGSANAQFHHAVMRLSGLDPLVTELVRLRCGRYHDCRACCSLRLVHEGTIVMPGPDPGQELTRAQAAALRYASAHTEDPYLTDQALADELHACFTTAQLVELTLDVSAWSYQKVLVALSLDRPASPDGLTGVVINPDGTMTRQGLLH
jgi:alkylhydroperoxidase family enzyme